MGDAIGEDRRREVFRDWLVQLGASGWSGTAAELHEELTRFLDGHRHRYGVRIPAGAGLSQWLRGAESVVEGAGRRLQFTRTKSERVIAFTPPAGVKPPTPAPPAAPRPRPVRRTRGNDGRGVLDLLMD